MPVLGSFALLARKGGNPDQSHSVRVLKSTEDGINWASQWHRLVDPFDGCRLSNSLGQRSLCPARSRVYSRVDASRCARAARSSLRKSGSRSYPKFSTANKLEGRLRFACASLFSGSFQGRTARHVCNRPAVTQSRLLCKLTNLPVTKGLHKCYVSFA